MIPSGQTGRRAQPIPPLSLHPRQGNNPRAIPSYPDKMLMSAVSHVLSAWFAFILPGYETWKALSHKPLSEPDLERWSMYWVVMGAFIAFESVAGWLVSWFPFYWEMRTILFLFLALPQTQGSTWAYKTYFEPFFIRNEADIDAGIETAKTNSVAFLQEKLGGLWESIWRLVSSQRAQAQQAAPGQPSASEPSTGRPGAPNVAAMGANLFHTYGPLAMGIVQRSFGYGQQTQPEASRPEAHHLASSSSVQPRTSYAASSDNIGTPSQHSDIPPPFPEPKHY